MTGFPPDALQTRRAALETHGFTVIAHTPDHLIAVRKRFYWGAAVRISTILRVRRVAHAEQAELSSSLGELIGRAGGMDPSRIPRGLQQMRNVLDVVLADTADEDALQFARTTNRKGMGASGQTLVVLPDGQLVQCKVVWGAAYLPWFQHVGRVAGLGDTTPEPGAPMGTFIGLFLMWPSLIMITLMLCGLPLLVPLYARIAEKPPQPAALPDRG